MDLSGLFEPKAEEVFRRAAQDEDGVTFDTKSTTLVSIAVSLRRIADWLEANSKR